MRSRLLNSFIFLLSLFSFLFILSSCDDETYTITWKDEDGKVLKTDTEVKKGDTPKYDGVTPTKEKDNTYTYTFSGWSPEVKKVDADNTYTAVYDKEYINYTVTFYKTTLEGNVILSTKNDYHYGDKVVEPESPTLDSTLDTTYTFTGWDKEVTTVSGNTSYYAVFTPSTRKYNVIFKNDDGTILKEAKSYDYGTLASDIEKPANPTKNSDMTYTYNFKGWNPEISNVTGDVTFVATYENIYKEYIVSFVNEGVTINSNKYHYGDQLTIPENPTKLGNEQYTYEFTGWDSEIVNCDGDKVYTATYKQVTRKYNVTFIDYDDTTIIKPTQAYDYGTEASNIEIPIDPVRSSDNIYSYEFAGWTPTIRAVAEDTTYKATYTSSYIDYTVSLYSNVFGVNEEKGAGTYHYNDEVTIDVDVPKGHTFTGWYKNDDTIFSDNEKYTFSITSDLSLEARFVRSKYLIFVEPNDLSYGGIESGTKYEYLSSITVYVDNQTNNHIVWYINNEYVHYGDSFTFEMPAEDIELSIKSVSSLENILYTKNEDKIYFGSYPQTLVTDDDLIMELDLLADELPEGKNLHNWIDYNYYENNKKSSFMYYQDIDYDNDGIYDYRGVYFTKYRPVTSAISGTSDNSYQDENSYEINKTYWFKYETIEWKILNVKDGRALLIANLILDNQEYQAEYVKDPYYHNKGTGYANNYKLSDIRKWLNEQFYEVTFTDLEKDLIYWPIVDNSKETLSDKNEKYACDNTFDDIFLLSYSEAEQYFANDDARKANSTDYAKCQGLRVTSDCAKWLLRSPQSSYDFNISVVYNAGNIDINPCYRSDGIRPACYIYL